MARATYAEQATKKARISPGLHNPICGLRLLRRQRQRRIRLGIQVGDDVGAFVVLLVAGEAHGGALDVLLRRGQEVVDVVEIPDLLAVFGEALHGSGIAEVGEMSDRTADNAIEIRADLV